MLKRIGKQALTTGAYIASDMLGGKKFNESAQAPVRQGIKSFLPPDEDVSDQTGSGGRRRVLKRDGTAIGNTTHVAPCNLFLHSLFSEIDVKLNGTLITSSNNTTISRLYRDAPKLRS